jgi:hypothetical protein
VEVSHSDLDNKEAPVKLEAFADLTLEEGRLKLYSFADPNAKGINEKLASVIIGAAFDRPSPVQVRGIFDESLESCVELFLCSFYL